ncbi:MAG TPA: hypothetical protein VHU41_00925 [Thermoanaerobaculia bacterium]|nr:hypothetical protein [Thermoanaerobaculia bacterium]
MIQRYVSYAREGIDGESGDFMGGFGRRAARPPEGSIEPPPAPLLYARCVVLWDDEYANILVSVDVLGIPKQLRTNLLRRIREVVAGLAPKVRLGRDSDFVLIATHTHNAPAVMDVQPPYIMWGLGADEVARVVAYTSKLEDNIFKAVESALNANKQPCTLEIGWGETAFAMNRSDLRPNAHVEKIVPVLVARSVTGEKKPLAVMFGYACHPLSGVGNWWDSEFPGRACELIELEFGVFALFLQGASGDHAPKNQNDDNGQTLAAVVGRVVEKDHRPIAGSIQSREISVPLPRSLPPKSELEHLYRQRLQSTDAARQRHGSVMLEIAKSGEYADSVPLTVIVWHFMLPDDSPPLKIVFTGGELVSEYARDLRAALKPSGTEAIVVAYANDMPGYIPTDAFLPPKTSDSVTYPAYEGGWDETDSAIAGGSQVGYGQFARYLKGGESRDREGIQKVLGDALLAAVRTPP